MEALTPDQILQFTIVTTVVVGTLTLLGSAIPTLMEGRAVVKAFDNMARQPSVADRIRSMMFVVMAILETGAIYVLLINLILLFANPFRAALGI